MERAAEVARETKETKIRLSVRAGSGKPGFSGTSGVGFFDHMLNTFATHGGMEISLEMSGDLEVDCHHTVEDVGISLGSALRKIIDCNKAINRFASEHVPMDESLAFCAVDLGGRAFFAFNADFTADSIGGYDVQMTREFFSALSANMLANIHISLLYGENDHHKTEAVFKAAARALKKALEPSGGEYIPSAKGTI